jgi:hypothetical protein
MTDKSTVVTKKQLPPAGLEATPAPDRPIPSTDPDPASQNRSRSSDSKHEASRDAEGASQEKFLSVVPTLSELVNGGRSSEPRIGGSADASANTSGGEPHQFVQPAASSNPRLTEAWPNNQELLPTGVVEASDKMERGTGSQNDFVPPILISPPTWKDDDFNSSANQATPQNQPTPSEEGPSQSDALRTSGIPPLSDISTKNPGLLQTIGTEPRRETPSAGDPSKVFEFPHWVTFSLELKMDGSSKGLVLVSLRWYEKDTYHILVKVARDSIRDAIREEKSLVNPIWTTDEICSLQKGSFYIGTDISLPQSVKNLDNDNEYEFAEKLTVTICEFFAKHPFDPFWLNITWAFATMGVPINPKEAYTDTVSRALYDRKVKGWGEEKGEEKEYFPTDDLFQIIHKTTSSKIIDDDRPLRWNPEDFKHLVQWRAKKLLAVCVWVKLPMSFLEDLLDSDKQFSDEILPTVDTTQSIAAQRPRDIQFFLRDQPMFFAYQFKPVNDGTKDFLIADNVIMPLTKIGLKGEGAFSEVFSVKIHPQHHLFEIVSEPSNYVH